MNLFANDIIDQVCEKHGISKKAVLSPRRGDGLPAVRVEIIHRMHTEFKLGPVAIARLLDRDHTTICHHLKKLKQNPSPDVSPLPPTAKTETDAATHTYTHGVRLHPYGYRRVVRALRLKEETCHG